MKVSLGCTFISIIRILVVFLAYSTSSAYAQGIIQGRFIVYPGEQLEYSVPAHALLPGGCYSIFHVEGGTIVEPSRCSGQNSCQFGLLPETSMTPPPPGSLFTIKVKWDNDSGNNHKISYSRESSQPPHGSSGHPFGPPYPCGLYGEYEEKNVTMVPEGFGAGHIYGDTTICVGAKGEKPHHDHSHADPIVSIVTIDHDVETVLKYDIEPVPTAESYTWSVTGGQIVSGQGTESVMVKWTTPGLGRLEVYPSNPLVPQGISGILDVHVYPQLSQPGIQGISYNHTTLSSSVGTSSSRSLVINHCANNPPCVLNEIDKAELYVVLNLGEDYTNGTNAFNTKMSFEIKGYGAYSGTSPEIVKYNSTLNINARQPEQVYYVDFTNIYPQIYRFDVSIIAYNTDPQVQEKVYLKVYYQEKFKIDARSLSSPITINQVNTHPARTNQLTFTWNSSCVDFPRYEFQLLRLYNSDESNTTDPQTTITANIDWTKALTIETQSSNPNLTLSVVEGSGYYVCRVRPIGNYYEEGIANPKNWGKWSDTGNFIQGKNTVAVTSDISPYCFYYHQFDDDINWIYSRTFTEGDMGTSTPVRINEQMTFANGLNQLQQEQKNLQTEGIKLVAQTVYDYSGRPSIKSMTVPVYSGTQSVGYVDNFMKNGAGIQYAAEDFDTNDNYDEPAKVKDDSSAEDHFSYYSNNNTNVNIPSAEGYPFTRTLYFNDGTNRVKEQGGIGETHRIKKTGTSTTRTIKKYYSAVADNELIRVFGDEAPKGESVYKMIDVDPNKVPTVTYIDKEGKTIATCLGINGENNYGSNTATLNGLPSKPTGEFRVYFDEINKNNWGDYGNQSVTPVTIMEPTIINLEYELTPNEIKDTCLNYSKNCDYFVEFLVQNVEEPEKLLLYSNTSPKTSEVLKTSPVTVILIYFKQYFEALFPVKTYFLTAHLEKYFIYVENDTFSDEIHEKLQNQDILSPHPHPLCFVFQLYPIITYAYLSRRIRSHVAKKSFSQSLYPSKRYTIFLPVLSI